MTSWGVEEWVRGVALYEKTTVLATKGGGG